MMFEELYNYWFSNSELWFNSTEKDDEEITKLFEKLYNEEINYEIIKTNKKYGIGVILLYDQISRHINRTLKTDLFYYWNKENFVKETTTIAYIISAIVYFYHKQKLNADEYAFIMLPFRHTYDFKKIKYVIEETWKRLKIEIKETEKAKYKQFLKATYERAIVQSDDREYIKKYEKSQEENEFNFDFIKIKYKNILDIKCNENKELTEITKKIMDEIKNKINLIIKLKEKSKLILSLSGGVDSIICSYILKKLNIDFCCVHINYNNRKESIEEENFVIEWCKIINIELYVRRIEEINRPLCMEYNMREIYETYTREVRYGTYIKVDTNPYVILGHNQDDCFENILTNITHKSKYENLNGMELISEMKTNNKNITFIRPMLLITKNMIYNFASENNIPYLFDSTPKWSQRGKIRDTVRPTLESWDNDIVNGFFDLSEILKESLELVDTLVENWITKIEENKINEKINNIPSSKIFWKKLFEKLKIKCSSRSLEGLINFIKKIKTEEKYDINTIIKFEINKTQQLRVLRMRDKIATIFFIGK
jgi:tRNA(Ile)-lysidine synthetase-like protein